MKVEDIIKRDVKVCTNQDNLDFAARLMWENDCGCVPVVASDGNGALVGIVTDRDICMAAYTQGKALRDISVTTAMARQVLTCKVGDDVALLEAIMREARIRRIPVVDNNGVVEGIISLSDIARASVGMRDGKSAQASQAEVARTLASISEPRGHELAPLPQAA